MTRRRVIGEMHRADRKRADAALGEGPQLGHERTCQGKPLTVPQPVAGRDLEGASQSRRECTRKKGGGPPDKTMTVSPSASGVWKPRRFPLSHVMSCHEVSFAPPHSSQKPGTEKYKVLDSVFEEFSRHVAEILVRYTTAPPISTLS